MSGVSGWDEIILGRERGEWVPCAESLSPSQKHKGMIVCIYPIMTEHNFKHYICLRGTNICKAQITTPEMDTNINRAGKKIEVGLLPRTKKNCF